MRHRKVFVAIFVAASSLLVWLAPMPEARAAEKPNVIFILMDNLGYGEVGVYGGGIASTRSSRSF